MDCLTPHRHPPANAALATRVVGLGASAGGLSALEDFFRQVSPGSGLAYVVVQHMDPTRQAMLCALLQRVTSLPVKEAVDHQAIEPDAVYVIPPDKVLTIERGHLRLAAPTQPRGMRLPIDVMLNSLARDQGERATGVVLSGMGTDGTTGLQAIRSQGGLTLAQSPETAQFDSMPLSAIHAACVDIVAPPGDMPARILRVVESAASPLEDTGPEAKGAKAPQGAPSAHDPTLAVILNLVRDHSKRDLSLYKSSTVLRRIERRVAVHGLESMAAYAAFLQHNPQELDLLFAEMLIGVTSFFRDPEVWQDLKNQIQTDLNSAPPSEAVLRAWVVGCSTGEEAYTLAMVFREAQDELSVQRPLQIFATDLSAEAIAVARKGFYPAKALAGLSPDRLKRFFTAQETGFQIDQGIRDMVLFAQHDVILDPPFTRLDILSCRNVLIYFNATLQGRLMPLFHYSLRPGGLLLLGGSETVGRSPSLFTPLSSKSRLYRRNDHIPKVMSVEFPINRLAGAHKKTEEPLVSTSAFHPPPNLQFMADQLLLQGYAPAAVLVNDAGDILYISGRTGRYLEPAAGKANWNIHVMARASLRSHLAVALRQAIQQDQVMELSGLQIEDDPRRLLEVTIQPIHEPLALRGMVMVVFKEVPKPPTRRSRKPATAQDIDTALMDELQRSRDEANILRQEMQASKEELQAANEALQSANEELQSANEELTTSKEEAQSMNEELQTINGELQSKLDDLALAQSDMQNLLNSIDIATLFLDDDLHVRRYTEQATSIFHLREGDIGRPLSDLATTLDYPSLYSDAKETLRTLSSCEKEIATTDGRWFSVRIMPYRTQSNMIQGTVLTFVNITVAKELESRLRKG